jgi:molecular chaperone GrpE
MGTDHNPQSTKDPDATDEPGTHPPDADETATGPGPDEASPEAIREEAAENWNKYLRAVAEMDNLRKRSARELENARKYGVEKLAEGLLPVRDSIEAGLKAAEEAEPASVDVTSLLEGERATLRLLDQALGAVGIREVDPVGEPFDPARHEAMSMLPSAEAEPGSVLTVIQKGYELHDRVLRPARVIVAREPAETDASGGSQGEM